jgi:hypothetical protein
VYDQSGQTLKQIHDFNPGIAPDGLFWTQAMDPRSVQVNPGTGRATFEATNLPMPDYKEFTSSITTGESLPGVVSFRVEWEPSHDRHRYRYAPNRWEGTFVQTNARCTWSGRTAEAEFSTNTNDRAIFAEVGHERSGVFFS